MTKRTMDLEPETATSFKMPSIQAPALNPVLVEKSAALSSIYAKKDYIEKQYGDMVKTMSPLKELNK